MQPRILLLSALLLLPLGVAAQEPEDVRGHYLVDAERGPKGGSVVVAGSPDDLLVTFRLADGSERVLSGRFDGQRLVLREANDPRAAVITPAGADRGGLSGALSAPAEPREGEGGAGDPAGPAATDATPAAEGVYLLRHGRLRYDPWDEDDFDDEVIPTRVFEAQGPVDPEGLLPVASFAQARIELRLEVRGNQPVRRGEKVELRARVRPKLRGDYEWQVDREGLKKKFNWWRQSRRTYECERAGEYTVTVRFTPWGLKSEHLASATLTVTAPPRIERAKLQSVRFLSDHGLLLDNDRDWDGDGEKYPEPEWTPERSAPLSHTLGETVRVEVTLKTEPEDAEPVPVVLRGEGGGLRFEKRLELGGGVHRIVLESEGFERKIQRVDLGLDWSLTANEDALPLEPARTEHEVYVTYATPTDPARVKGITLKRMRKAVEAASAARSLDPHVVVRKVMSKWGNFNLKVAYYNAWELGEDERDADGSLVGADCQTIVRFARNVIKMVGLPGEAEFVVVWAKVETPAKGEVSPNARNHMTRPRQYYNDHAETPDPERRSWIAALVDGSGGLNNYEAALLFEHGGKRKFYPGGVSAVMDDADQVIGVFTTMSWVDTRDFKAGAKEHIYRYR
ncbi:MAG: hypothetical protein D6731_23210 [Planctomycetota bacterium]|nr:MAG: hypothetical protein D6731_23210 [Planctomycetota bacterium]